MSLLGSVTYIELRHELDAVGMALQTEVEAAQAVARQRVRAAAHHHRCGLVHLHDLGNGTPTYISQGAAARLMVL